MLQCNGKKEPTLVTVRMEGCTRASPFWTSLLEDAWDVQG